VLRALAIMKQCCSEKENSELLFAPANFAPARFLKGKERVSNDSTL
jgi:hypothetical protein